MEHLEYMLEQSFQELDVDSRSRDSIRNYLGILRVKDKETYEHSIRAGMISARISRQLGLDPKPAFFAGTLHDIGKMLIEPSVLKKKQGFSKQDLAQMKIHPQYTYLMLRGVHEFSAEIALRHHLFQERPYPESIPACNYPGQEGLINSYSRIISLADFYDSATNRNNGKFGRKLTPAEAKDIMIAKNPDAKRTIEQLYCKRAFEIENEFAIPLMVLVLRELYRNKMLKYSETPTGS